MVGEKDISKPVSLAEIPTKSTASGDSDGTVDKLLREASGFLGGSGTGIQQSISDAVDHKGESALKIGAGFAIGAAMTFATRGRYLGALTESIGTALSVTFLGDIAMKAPTIGSAWNDIWSGDEAAGRDKIAKTVGPFVVDSALFGAGAIPGGIAGSAGRMRLDRAMSNRIEPSSLGPLSEIVGPALPKGWKETGYASGAVKYHPADNPNVSVFFQERMPPLAKAESTALDGILSNPGRVQNAKLEELGSLTRMQRSDEFKLKYAKSEIVNGTPMLITEGTIKETNMSLRSYFYKTNETGRIGEIHFQAPKNQFDLNLPSFEKLLRSKSP